MRERFPGIKIIKLKNNYRSTKEIIKLSSNIIKQIPPEERLDGLKELDPQKDYKNKNIEFVSLSTEDEEIMYIVKKIRQLKKIIEN